MIWPTSTGVNGLDRLFAWFAGVSGDGLPQYVDGSER